MLNEPLITLVGNLGSDPELKVTPSGKTVAQLSVATTPRKQVDGEWVDGEVMWFRVSIWGKEADAVNEKFVKGMRVIVTGRFKAESWKDKEGANKTTFYVSADTVGEVARFTSNSKQESSPEEAPW